MKNDAHNYGVKQALACAFAFFCFFCAIQLALFSRQYQYTTEEWIKVGENEDGQMFYEKQSLVRSISREIVVLTKHTYSFEAHKVIAAVLPKIAGFFYIMALDRIDCGEQRYISLRMASKTVEEKRFMTPWKGGAYTGALDTGQYLPTRSSGRWRMRSAPATPYKKCLYFSFHRYRMVLRG